MVGAITFGSLLSKIGWAWGAGRKNHSALPGLDHTLSSAEFESMQAAIDAAVHRGKTLIVEPESSFGQVFVGGRLTMIARGRTICTHNGRGGPWVTVAPGAEFSHLEFDEVDFSGNGTIGIQLDAAHCHVLIRVARNMSGLPYGVANRQCAVLSQAADNTIDVCAYDFRVGSSDNGSVPRVITTDRGSTRNAVRVKAYKTNTVWVENGENNSAEYVIADSVTDNGIYNLSGSTGMTCEYLHYTNSKEEAFVLEGVKPHIRKAIYDGWSYPGVQNCRGAVVDEIVLLPPPDASAGGVSTCTLRSRDGNIQSDIFIGRISGFLNIGSKRNIGAYFHFYVGSVDYSIGEQDLKISYLEASRAESFVVHRNGQRVDLGSVRITFDDTAAHPQKPLVWACPRNAQLGVRKWLLDPKPYGYLAVKHASRQTASLPTGRHLNEAGDLVNPQPRLELLRTEQAVGAR